MEKEVFEELLIATVLASTRKIKAGLRNVTVQDYPDGVIEVSIALDAIDMLVKEIFHCIITNTDEVELDELFLTEACRLWRVLYGNEIAFTKVVQYFALKAGLPKARWLRHIAENASCLVTRLNELADDLEL